MDALSSVVSRLQMAQHVVIFTGAGVSAESAIPTFRDALTGLWSRYDPSLLASPEGFLSDPDLVWGWYEWRRRKSLLAAPNAAHRSIAALANCLPELTLITQNVDNLHERSGSSPVLRLHGSLHHPRCFNCATPYPLPEGIPDEPDGGRRLPPPRCGRCGGPVRPGVVWFGESLPEPIWKQAEQATDHCDLLFSIGTSSLVWPAAHLPFQAKQNGATVVQVNPNATTLDPVADYNLRGLAGEIMPSIFHSLQSSLAARSAP
ncbi:SIR2 family NAD-dependent protein deacylase [Candidatus Magnetaquicoccus inordinatus]|uniref:SIR2 family NAD-dependent protein deacylase n=1 Tax=Candidatus Magnetaquicoccus inordinatus TaxID=2496818 RepID=UPI00102BAD8F|nr:NAD-dependent deacylase [Candidatus Magnetaquicoccus inordinatus]